MNKTTANSSHRSINETNPLEAEILRLAREDPELGQAAVANRLQQKGFKISASGVRYIWQKHGLETTLKRLQSILSQNNGSDDSLTELQQRFLERGLLGKELARGKGKDDSNPDVGLFSNEEFDRRSIIINAAAELFSANGYDQTSIRKIAKKAGLLPGSVYHHFTSKEALYLTVHREGLRFVMSQIKAAVEEESVGPWNRLKCAFTVHISYMVGESSPMSRFTGHNLALTANSHLLEQLREDRDAYESVMRDLVLSLPLSNKVDRTLLRLMLLGAANWVYVWYREDKLSPSEIANKMIDMIRFGTEG